jgi:DNA/RNA-binding domain of Phe-tRNA-synthetase-like protein
MKQITILPELKAICPELTLACVECKLHVKQSDDGLREMIHAKTSDISSGFQIEDISKIPAIAASRKAFKKLGKDPSRYRFSAEALLRRIVNRKELYFVNNVIDILNLISFESGFSIGGYDSLQISGDIRCGTGKESESYQAIGRGEMNIANIIVLRDDIGSFGTPVSDSERTSVSMDTSVFLMIFFNFMTRAEINPWISIAEDLLKQFCMAHDFHHINIS